MKKQNYDPFLEFDPETQGEVNSGEVLVETEGYVETNLLIENMIYAGARLDRARSDMYDFPNEEAVDEDFIDPTRKPGTDITEIEVHAAAVTRRMSEQKRIFEEEERQREAERKRAEGNGPV